MSLAERFTRGSCVVHVRPGSGRSEIVVGDEVVVFLRSAPEDNKANIELVKLLSKALGRQVRIRRGLRSKTKIVAFV